MTDAIVSPRISPKQFLKKMAEQSSPQQEEEVKLITFEEYKRDIKERWKIVKREVKEFIEDVKKLIDFLSPIIKENIIKTIEWIKSFKKK